MKAWERERERERERETWMVKERMKKIKRRILKWSGKIIEYLIFGVL